MTLSYNTTTKRFECVTTYAEKEIPKQAGCHWDGAVKRWTTSDHRIAARLRAYADAGAVAALDQAVQVATTTSAASRATDATVDIPCPEGLTYYGFQKAGVAFLADHPSALLGDEMGVGKTIQICGLLNYLPANQRVLIVCPASLRLNWQRELDRWIVPARNLAILQATTKHTLADLIAHWESADAFQATDALRIVVINYDILHRFETRAEGVARNGKKTETYQFGYQGLDLLVADEAHFLKTEGARRSKAVRCIPATRRVLLTGTPLVNRPKELFPLLNYLDRDAWPNFFAYAKEFCDAHQEQVSRDRLVWNFDGASNLGRLQDRLRSTLMIRRLKRDVLTELPAKQRQVIEIPANGASAAIKAEQAMVARHAAELARLRDAAELAKASESEEVYQEAVALLRKGSQVAFTEMSQARHDTAVAKVPHVVAHVEGLLESVGKVIVFFHHHDVEALLSEQLATYQPSVITGETPMPARQAAVDRFQTDPACRVFLGSLTAAGVGLTLTAASHVVFAELDWVPGNISQAEDRAHRISQREMVLVQHLVLEGSLDATMAKRLIAKQAVIDATLDTGSAPADAEESLIPLAEPEEPATAPLTRARVVKDAPALSDQEITDIHDKLRQLAEWCDGARARDGAGFSKIDVGIGRSLAASPRLTARQAVLGQRLATKYRRQFMG